MLQRYNKYNSNSLKHVIKFSEFEQYKNKININKTSLAYVRERSIWLLPQLMAFLNKTVKLVRTEDGSKFSFSNTLSGLGSDLAAGNIVWEGEVVDAVQMKGILNVLIHHPRGEILKEKQSSTEGSRFSAGVPLILSAFKEYRDVKYSDWDWSDEKANWFVDPQLLELVPFFEAEMDFSSEQLTYIRELCVDRYKKALSSVTLIGAIPGEPEFNKLPKLVKLLLTQCWIYHPSHVHKLCISNLGDIDSKATPLVSIDFVKDLEDTVTPNPSRKKKVVDDNDLPWDV